MPPATASRPPRRPTASLLLAARDGLCRSAAAVLVVLAVSACAAAQPAVRYAGTIALNAPAGTASLDVGGTLPVGPIPAGFVGLSIEYDALGAYMGANGLDPVFLALVRGLNPGQAPILRIGGDSADYAWVPVAGMAPPPGILYTITPAWLHAFGALVRALSARVVLDINLEPNSPLLAQTEARALVAGGRAPCSAGA